MSAFWVRFDAGPRAMCVEGRNEAAVRERAAAVGVVRDVRLLPYPARPRLEPYETWEWQGKQVTTPEFCYAPDQCAGRTACPQRYACSE